MKVEIKHRWTGNLLFSVEAGSLKRALELAVKSRAYLRNADLRGAVLWGADLRGAVLRGADLRGAGLQGAVLRGADLQGADFQGAVLCGADLQGAYLRDAALWGADLRGAYFRDAALQDAAGKKFTLKGRRPVCTSGPHGSRGDSLISYCTGEGLYLRAGCWFGSAAEFEARVRSVYPDGPYGVEYLSALDLHRLHEALNRETWTEEERPVRPGR